MTFNISEFWFISVFSFFYSMLKIFVCTDGAIFGKSYFLWVPGRSGFLFQYLF